MWEVSKDRTSNTRIIIVYRSLYVYSTLHVIYSDGSRYCTATVSLNAARAAAPLAEEWAGRLGVEAALRDRHA